MNSTTLRLPNGGVPRSTASIALWITAACLITFAVRASLPAYLYGDSLQHPLLLAELGSLALLAGFAFLAGGVGPRVSVALMMVAAATSIATCEDAHFAAERWVAWSLLLLSIGPLNSNPIAKVIRRGAFSLQMTILLWTTALSAAWWIVGLPSLGRGDFTGVTCHSMTLGAMSCLGGVWALVRMLENPAPIWRLLYFVSIAVGMLAASRSALAALALATLVAIALRVRNNPLPFAAVVLFAGVATIAPSALINLLGTATPDQLAEGLSKKELNHSREHHWEARWDEFASSPYTGVGFASGWYDTAGVSEDTGSVEAGSSYIAILSMTGVVGAVGFGIVIASIAWRFALTTQRMPRHLVTEIACFGAYWFVHLGAEGYVYAVGSLMGMTFWLWIGRVYDMLEQATAPRVVTRPLPYQRGRAVNQQPRAVA